METKITDTMYGAPEVAESKAELRDNILKLEAVIKAMPERQIHIEPSHYFADGLYLREIKIPRDVTLTGKIHKTEHYCILSQGEVSVRTEDGVKRLKAPCVIHSLPGMKRVMYAHEDSTWINIHHNPSNEQDLNKIEAFYVVDTYRELESFNKSKLLEEKGA